MAQQIHVKSNITLRSTFCFLLLPLSFSVYSTEKLQNTSLENSSPEFNSGDSTFEFSIPFDHSSKDILCSINKSGASPISCCFSLGGSYNFEFNSALYEQFDFGKLRYVYQLKALIIS